MACTKEGFSPDQRPVFLRTADEGACRNGPDEGQGEGDEGGEGGSAPASNSSNQRQAHKKGREGTIREDGREDAPQASGASEAQGEAKQAPQLMRQSYAHAEGHGHTLHRQRHADSCEMLTMDTRCSTAMEAARSRTGGRSNISSPPSTLATQPALVAVCISYLVSCFFLILQQYGASS